MSGPEIPMEFRGSYLVMYTAAALDFRGDKDNKLDNDDEEESEDEDDAI